MKLLKLILKCIKKNQSQTNKQDNFEEERGTGHLT